MKIFLQSISKEGERVSLRGEEGWVRSMVEEALASENPRLETIKGEVAIHKVEENLSLLGKIFVELSPVCDRCGENYPFNLSVPLSMHLVPSDTVGEKGEENLNFGTHNGIEIDVGELVREMMVLALPFRFLCQESCRGLCPHCGINLNHSTCQCSQSHPLNPRWEALKNFASQLDKKRGER